MAQQMKEVGSSRMRLSSPFLYYATDPWDYQVGSGSEVKTYADVLSMFRASWGYYPFTSTAYPVRAKKEIMDKAGDKLQRLSLSEMNIKRLERDGHIKTFGDKGMFAPTHPGLAESLFFGGSIALPGIASWARIKSEKMSLLGVANQYWQPEDNDSQVYNFLVEVKDERYFEAGSQREKTQSHAEGHAGGDVIGDSIACRDGVIISPDGFRNSVRMLATNRYPNGLGEATLTPQNLQNGEESLKQIDQNVPTGTVHIEDILKYVIVDLQSYGGNPTDQVESLKNPELKNEIENWSMDFHFFNSTGMQKFGQLNFNKITGVVNALTLYEGPRPVENFWH
jgi:hypothetical protein